jgi:hypothetical protein
LPSVSFAPLIIAGYSIDPTSGDDGCNVAVCVVSFYRGWGGGLRPPPESSLSVRLYLANLVGSELRAGRRAGPDHPGRRAKKFERGR